MNKDEFLAAFQRAMESLGVQDQTAHYGFFEELFTDMGEEGFTEEEISARLGDPWELAGSLLREEEGRGTVGGERKAPPAVQTAPQGQEEPQAREEHTDRDKGEKRFNWRSGFLKFLRDPGKLQFRLNIGSEQTFETRVPPAGLEELEISWKAGELTVEAEDREDILLTEERDEDQPPLRWEVRGSCLYIVFAERPCSGKELTVLLPAALAKGLRRCAVNTLSADLTLSGLEAGELTVNSASGNQEVRSKAGRAEFSTASGDMELTVEAVEIAASTASGDISLESSGSAAGVKLSTASGDIRYDGTVGTLTLHTASGDVEYAGSAEEVQVKTASGDIYLELKDRPRGLDVNSVSGDVDVELPEGCACRLRFKSRSGYTSFSGIRTDISDSPEFYFNTVSGDIDVHC